jgi:predicted transcriptional regulator
MSRGDAGLRTIDSRREWRYHSFMTTKQKLLKAVRSLPNNATYEDAMERLLVLAKIDRGLKQLDAGETISHEKVKMKMRKWLK